ncbi:MAG: hypothetical protein IPL49_17155 [Saprospirales bacterium]|nr:hypothetical protein [Saprospirales bacterium]
MELLDAFGAPVDDPTQAGFQPYMVTTNANGEYLFEGLPAGTYKVLLTTVNFSPSSPLDGYLASSGPGQQSDPEAAGGIDQDANGLFSANPATTGIVSGNIILGPGSPEPLNETLQDPNVPTVPDGNSNMTLDFGLFHPLSVGDYVWFDSNSNGIQDPGESPVEGATVTIYNADGSPVTLGADGSAYTNTTTRDGLGAYEFTNLPPGEYYLVLTPPGPAGGYDPTVNGGDPDNFTSNSDNNGYFDGSVIRTDPFVLESDTEIETLADDGDNNYQSGIDFGLVGYSLGNRVFADENNDGLLNGSDIGISGVTVRLLDGSGNPVKDPANPTLDYVVITDAFGYYRFDNLPEGNYIVEIDTPSGYFSSTTDGGDPDPNDDPESDPQDSDDNGTVIGASTIRSGVVFLGDQAEPTGETNLGTGDANIQDNRANLTVDFALIQPMNVGDYVWYDTNGDGQQGDPTLEPPVEGAVMTLYFSDGTPATDIQGNPVGSYTTGPDGLYEFTNLAPGDYYVVMTPPVAGYEPTVGGLDDPDTDPSDTDNNGALVGGIIRTPVFTLVNNTEPNTPDDGDGTNGNLTLDFGLAGYSLGNRIWEDANDNGQLDGTEVGIGGVTVKLYAADGVTEIPVGPDGILGTADDAFGGVITDANGYYRFDNLPAGDYVVEVVGGTGTPLDGYLSSTSNAGDPDSDVDDGDDNGTVIIGTNVQSQPVTLGPGAGEPPE